MPDGSYKEMNHELTEGKSDKDAEFLSAIQSAESLAYGSQEESSLGEERSRAIDDYLGRPYGNEVEGRSQVVSRDVYDTIEWIKPSILRIFTGGDEVAKFDPIGPEDEEQSHQETDYINYVLMERNNWFMTCYEWFTDALMTKNAYALAYWDKKTQVESEKYEGLTDEQLVLFSQDPEVEIVQHTAYQNPNYMPVPGPDGQIIPPDMLHDVVIKRNKEYSGVKICVLPPERVMVSESLSGMSVRDSDFFEYWEMVTISDIRKMGYDIPDDINDDAGEIDGPEDNSRDLFNENFARRNDDSSDPAGRKVCLRTLWIKYDYDGDGIAELRMVMKVGSTILYNEESVGVQVACIVPTPLSHRHPGLSVRDMITDLQLIKTTIWRQTLDNLYLANNGRYGISDKVNLDDMLTSRPGGVVRVANGALPGQEIVPLVHPFVAGQSLEVLNYADQIIEHRTGTNQSFTGVDPNAISKAHSGVAIAQLSSAAAQRVELIARVFAEGVKELCLIVHELCIKHHHKAAVVKLRNQWVTVNPSDWKRRTDLKISVGLGTGNKEQLMTNLSTILTAQKEALAAGITTPKKIYNALTQLTKAAGFPNPSLFWDEPKDGPMQPQPNPDEIKAKALLDQEQMKQQGETQRLMMELQADAQKTQAQLTADQQKTQFQAEVNVGLEEKRIQTSHEAEIEKTKAMTKPAVTMDAGAQFDQFVAKMEENTLRQENTMTQIAGMMEQAVNAIAQASQMMAQAAMTQKDEIIIRDKSGRAVGKKTVPAGTLQ